MQPPSMALCRLCGKSGVRLVAALARATAGNVIRFMPPLNVKDAELEEAIEMLDEALEIWHDDLNAAAEAVAEAAGEVEAPAEEEAPAEAEAAEEAVEESEEEAKVE